jgi:hypothetical protein
LAIVAGALGPWESLGFRIDGFQDAVVLMLGCIAACIVVLRAKSDRRWIADGPLVIGLTAAALVANNIHDHGGISAFGGSDRLHWGIYVAFCGSAVLALASVLQVIDSPWHPVLRRSARRLVSVSDDYPALSSFCILVGYRRGGFSLLGALLNAHPDAAVAPDPKLIRLVARHRLGRTALCDYLVRRATRHYKMERKRSHPYVVRGKWQERVRTLRVVGAKCGDNTIRRLRDNPSSLDLLEQTVGVPLRIVHVTRNPYDVIAEISLSQKSLDHGRSIPSAISSFAQAAQVTDDTVQRLRDSVLTVPYETLIADPRSALSRICEFLGLNADDDYLATCARVVPEELPPPRRLVAWSDDDRAAVERLIDQHSALGAYTWGTSA